jgi:hypothetical protein
MSKHDNKRNKKVHSRRAAQTMKRKRESAWPTITLGVIDMPLVGLLGYWAYQGFVLHRHVHIPINVILLTGFFLVLTIVSAYSWWRG